jgi:hypothetical protein
VILLLEAFQEGNNPIVQMMFQMYLLAKLQLGTEQKWFCFEPHSLERSERQMIN